MEISVGSNWLEGTLNILFTVFLLYCEAFLSFVQIVYYLPFSGNTTDFSSSPTRETDPLGKPRFKGMCDLNFDKAIFGRCVSQLLLCSKQPQNLSSII